MSLAGLINIYKEPGMTSFDVVARVRRKLGEKRVGHLGTLDPMAEGVLPVAVGSAGRVMEYLDGDRKEYEGEAWLGFRSDTEDIWGKELCRTEGAAAELLHDRERLEEALKTLVREKMTGVVRQVPPKYSALKVNGRKLYEYARAGEEVAIASRTIYVESFAIRDVRAAGKAGSAINADGREEPQPAGFSFRVRVSKGTYVRTLCADIGEALGCGAVMSRLVRTASGIFRAETALKIGELEAMDLKDPEQLAAVLIPADQALTHFGIVRLGEWESHLFVNGVCLRPEQWQAETRPAYEANQTKQQEQTEGPVPGTPASLPEKYARAYRVYDRNESFLGIGLSQPDGGLKAEKVFR